MEIRDRFEERRKDTHERSYFVLSLKIKFLKKELVKRATLILIHSRPAVYVSWYNE